MSNIVIDIAAEFTGKKAFKQADSAAAKLNSSVKKLAGAFGLAFSTQAVVQFSKQAVKAFAEDEAAATRLARAVDNLGIGFANPAIASYISNLEQSAKIADDVLRPAFQGLLTTTGSLTESQKLLNDAITISRASGIDLATVADDLGKGYIGVTKGLSKYNTGLTKAELQSKSFNEILGTLLKRSAGAAEDYLKTTAYQLDAISVASATASEIIGQGLVDSLLILSGNTTAGDLADDMLTAAENTAEFSRNIAALIKAINTPLDFASKGLAWFIEKTDPLADLFIEGDPSGFMKKVSKAVSSMSGPKAGFNGKTFYADAQKNADALALAEDEARKRAAQLLKIKNQQLENEKKQLAAKKLAAAIDKANIALGKSTDVFDLDKIQLAAAEKNQIELIGKVTNQAQLLAITNDLARLQIKKDIIALEDAIASKDQKAIEAATKKLNADLAILGALTGQDLKLKEIETIIDDIVPKDLINLDNLTEAIRLLGQINTTSITAKATATSTGSTFNPVSGFTAGVYGKNTPYAPSAEDLTSIFGAVPSIHSAAMTPPSAGFLAGVSGQKVEITVNTGVGDPNAIAEAITQVVREAQQRGTLTGAFGTL